MAYAAILTIIGMLLVLLLRGLGAAAAQEMPAPPEHDDKEAT